MMSMRPPQQGQGRGSRGLIGVFGLPSSGSFAWRHGKQPADARDVVGAIAIGEKPIVADSVEPFGRTWIRKRRMNSSGAASSSCTGRALRPGNP